MISSLVYLCIFSARRSHDSRILRRVAVMALKEAGHLSYLLGLWRKNSWEARDWRASLQSSLSGEG